jgi:hypothetical protein
LNRFKYDFKAKEEENFINLDVEHTKAFLDSDLVNFLIKQNFDLGIGSSYLANSLLYRLLDLNYIKIEQEDIESYQMQFKYGMPVLLSAYPSSQTYANFEYDDLPHCDSQNYRW